jgi:hypothetical protein
MEGERYLERLFKRRDRDCPCWPSQDAADFISWDEAQSINLDWTLSAQPIQK